MWHPNYEKGKQISLIKEYIYKRATLNSCTKLNKASISALKLYFQFKFFLS